MNRCRACLITAGIVIVLACSLWLTPSAQAWRAKAESPPAVSAHSQQHAYAVSTAVQAAQSGGECAVNAVDLIGAWVDAGAKEGLFPFESLDAEPCTADFETDVLPLFTTPDAWFPGSEACTDCHFDNSEDSRHEMDLSSLD
ncbi:MAG: hypothetical protein KC425_02370, partial [Anaerolineales bacterium]|nr:hypothetical protein [Anaerolineales bacterium]